MNLLDLGPCPAVKIGKKFQFHHEVIRTTLEFLRHLQVTLTVNLQRWTAESPMRSPLSAANGREQEDPGSTVCNTIQPERYLSLPILRRDDHIHLFKSFEDSSRSLHEKPLSESPSASMVLNLSFRRRRQDSSDESARSDLQSGGEKRQASKLTEVFLFLRCHL